MTFLTHDEYELFLNKQKVYFDEIKEIIDFNVKTDLSNKVCKCLNEEFQRGTIEDFGDICEYLATFYFMVQDEFGFEIGALMIRRHYFPLAFKMLSLMDNDSKFIKNFRMNSNEFVQWSNSKGQLPELACLLEMVSRIDEDPENDEEIPLIVGAIKEQEVEVVVPCILTTVDRSESKMKTKELVVSSEKDIQDNFEAIQNSNTYQVVKDFKMNLFVNGKIIKKKRYKERDARLFENKKRMKAENIKAFDLKWKDKKKEKFSYKDFRYKSKIRMEASRKYLFKERDLRSWDNEIIKRFRFEDMDDNFFEDHLVEERLKFLKKKIKLFILEYTKDTAKNQ